MTVLATMACTVSAAGCSKPAFADVLETLQSIFQGIYGSDAYIDPDSQDGQLLAAVAKAVDDSNDAALNVYNSFSPATAQGRALSSGVKINGIARAVPTKSTVPLRVTGTVGTTIAQGVASDSVGQKWDLPFSVTIPAAGFIDVTGTAQAEGALTAGTGTITGIDTPVLGWTSVTNTGPAVAGALVESDASLRQRQVVSTSLPSRTTLNGTVGAVANLPGVTAVRGYENDTSSVDANGLPAHSIALVVQGGVNTAIAEAIMLKKGPGCYTHGTTSVGVTDPGGITTTIRYTVPTVKTIVVAITVKALAGYTSATGDRLKAAIAAHISALGIGRKVDLGRLYLPAQLSGGPGSETYEVDALTIGISPAGPSAADAVMAYNEIAACAVGNVTLTVT